MKHLNVRAAALYIGVSKSFLDQLRIRGGGPPYIKIGQKVLYDVRDLDRWIEERKFKSTADEFSREQLGRKRA